MISLLLNLVTVILVTVSVAGFFFGRGEGNMAVAGTRCFRYYTVDSNSLVAIAGIPMIVYDIRGLLSRETAVPDWVSALKFTGTTVVMLTFLVVVFYLGPTQGYEKMYAGHNLYLHLVCPLCAMISFCFCETDAPMPWKRAWLAELPTVAYGAVYFVMVIVIGAENGGWYDFYGFNMGGRWYLSIVGMLAATAVIGFGLCALQRLSAGKRK